MAGNKQVVEAAYEAFGKGDIEGVLAMLDPSIEWSAPLTLPQGGEFRGTDGVLTFFQGLGAAWDPLGLEVEALGEVGPDVVVGIVRGSGSLRDGDAASYGAVHVFTVAGGKILRFREFTDLNAPLGG
jgi:ketosteroid isomerase-like protein